MNESDFVSLRRTIKQLLSIDVDAFKSDQMRRRLNAFVSRQEVSTIGEFNARLKQDPELLMKLRNWLTINVSEFFRDPPQFDYLSRVVLPRLLDQRAFIRIWSAGCSNGEEPYSVAILMAEMSAGHRASIIGTDFDHQVLQKARDGGPFPVNEVRNVPRRQLETYFVWADGGYYVTPQIRRRVQFAELNLLSDEFDTDFDLIICRNVLIYFEDAVKNQIIQRFHDALRPTGVLFVGASEALISSVSRSLFENLSGNFYHRKEAVRQPAHLV